MFGILFDFSEINNLLGFSKTIKQAGQFCFHRLIDAVVYAKVWAPLVKLHALLLRHVLFFKYVKHLLKVLLKTFVS